jgi:predicted transcriptional regulator
MPLIDFLYIESVGDDMKQVASQQPVNKTRESKTARRKNRSRDKVYAEMLEVCAVPTIKTHIMFKCNLSYAMLEECLGTMISKRWIESFTTDDGEKYYVATDEGRKALKILNEAAELLK